MKVGLVGLGRMGSNMTQRFATRGDGDFANKLLSPMRYQFGGHEEKR